MINENNVRIITRMVKMTTTKVKIDSKHYVINSDEDNHGNDTVDTFK